MKEIEKNLPKGDKWAPTVLVEKYEQQTAYILAALGEINENYKYSIITDKTTFKDFSYNPSFPIDDEALIIVSEALGMELTHDMTIVEAAREMFEKKLDYTCWK